MPVNRGLARQIEHGERRMRLDEVQIGRVACLFGLGSGLPTGEIPPLCLGSSATISDVG